MNTEQPGTDEKHRTRDLVHIYARQMLDEGVEVRQSDVRERIYTHHNLKASPNLVNEEIKKFWGIMGPVMSARLRRPGVPDAVCEKLDEIWGVALDGATASHEVERKALEGAAVAAQSIASAARASEQDAIARLESQNRELAGLITDKDRLTDQLDQAGADLRRLQESNADLASKLAEANQAHGEEVKRLQELHHGSIERIQDMHRAELERLQQQLSEANSAAENARTKAETARVEAEQHLERTENHLMMETARVRDEERGKSDKLVRELQQALTLVDQLRVLRSKATDEASELRGRLEATERSINSLEVHNKELREQNLNLQAALLEGFRGGKPTATQEPD